MARALGQEPLGLHHTTPSLSQAPLGIRNQLGDSRPIQSLPKRGYTVSTPPLHGGERLPSSGVGGRRRPRPQSLPDHLQGRRVSNRRGSGRGRVFEAHTIRDRDRSIPGETPLGQRQHFERLLQKIPCISKKE